MPASPAQPRPGPGAPPPPSSSALLALLGRTVPQLRGRDRTRAVVRLPGRASTNLSHSLTKVRIMSRGAGPHAAPDQPVFLSNRRKTGSFSEPLGVDRLSFSFPIADFDNDPGSWRQVTTRAPAKVGLPWTSSYSTMVSVGDAEVYVGVQSMPDKGKESIGWWGKCDLNPSRLEDPGGVSLASPSSAVRAASQAWNAAGQLLTPDCRLEESRIKRVDVARDFHGLAKPAGTIRALAPIPRAWARRNLVHADPARQGAQTLMVGSGSGLVRLYDKAVESGGKAPAGTVRWEAECRTGWASNYGGIKRFEDLTADNLGQLAENRWEWSAMGAEVEATSRTVESVSRSGLSEREQASFLGWLMMQAHGAAYRPGKASLAKWRKVQRDLGIALDVFSDDNDQAGGFVCRLDWETGREIVRAA